MNTNIVKIIKNLEKGFFGFWVRKFRVSYLLIFLIVIAGIFSMLSIPKESSPDIKFGIIGITTIYQGVSPNDMDSLITDKIEKEIKNVNGIKKITSVSGIGISSITVELDNSANIRDTLTDIKDAVDKVDLPNDANDPNIVELSTNSDLMFEVLLYGDATKFSDFDLTSKAQYIKNSLEGQIQGLSSIELGGLNRLTGLGTGNSDYEINILIDKNKLEQLNLSIAQISNIIRNYNKNTPIGNYVIGDLNYDFRFEGELKNIEELKNIVIRSSGSSNVKLKDISIIETKYKENSIKKLGFQNNTNLNYTSLLFNKNEGKNIFDISGVAKDKLEKFLKNDSNLSGLDIFYVNDLSEIIIDDYENLSKTAITTLLLVFITIFIFVGFKESIIASILIPLSFFVTFIVLYILGYSLNFLTNFSLVLTLGIAIDTVIVIVEAASEKIKMGYNKKTAALLAIMDYKAPLISGTLTTLVVFLPLMFLPGVMGKFLAYIPITVFITLLAALFLALTVSATLFIKFAHDSKYYHIDEKLEATFNQKQKDFLAYEREGKTLELKDKVTIRDKILRSMSLLYYNLLKKVILNNFARRMFIFLPILILILTFIFLSPKIGFILFPKSDNGVILATIEAKEGTNKEFLLKYLPIIDEIINTYDELKVYNMNVSGNKIDISIELIGKNEREKLGLKNVFDLESEIIEKLKILEKEGLNVSIKTISNGPPSGKAVGIKLIANSSSKVDELKNTANIFRDYIKTIDGTRNISSTSQESPGQFIFRFDKDKLFQLGLTPNDILNEVYLYTNGIKAGSIKSQYENNDIVLKIEQFQNELSPDDINNLIINTNIGKIRVGDFANYEFTKSVSSITRENGKITITVEADLDIGVLPSFIQPKIDDFSKNYIFPEGINFEKGGENQENADLIQSVFVSFFIALFLMFSILVFQFNSFIQPIIILYSVILAIIGVNIGLFLTGNPYSITFMIGFIAMTGVVVNDAIILIDRINKNLEKGIDNIHSVIGAGKSRLQPIIVTTLTTVFGVLPLALQDEFWAGLGFTIVFGLIAGSTMTLFVIPSLYYSLFLYGKDDLIKVK